MGNDLRTLINDICNVRSTKFLIVTLCLSWGLTSSVVAQNDAEVQSWFDLTYFYYITEKSGVGGDFGARAFVSSRDWSQVYVRPTYRYLFNDRIDLGGGIAFFHTFNKNNSNLSEWRLFQEANLDWPSFSSFRFNHRLRAEQRFFNYQDGTPDGSDEFAARLRYQLTLETNDFKVFGKEFFALACMEYFQRQNANAESFINQNRFVFILGRRLNDYKRLEIHYIHQRSRRFIENGLESSEHIIRLRYFRTPRFMNRIEQ